MTYNELKHIAKIKGIKIEDLCLKIGLTRVGFHKSMDNYSIPYSKIIKLCEILSLTPNQFFNYDSFIIVENDIKCPNCERKDLEIQNLKDKIIKLQEKLLNQLS